jgi:chemotaxis protein methyltransferase CheR
MIPITDREFAQFQKFIFENAGIQLSCAKKALVCGRLSKRVHQYGVSSYSQYLQLLSSGAAPNETQTAVDLLTTNETYFFREPAFRFPSRTRPAPRTAQLPSDEGLECAGSSGEESYSIAMVLEDTLDAGAAKGRPRVSRPSTL